MNKGVRLFFIVTSTLLIGLLFLITPNIPLKELKAKYANEESKFISIDGMDVHYRDQGSGQPIVLLHGTASSLHTWDEWAKSLKANYRVIRFDLPAFGLTGPHPDRDYSVDSYVGFVSKVFEKLKLDSVILAGNSLGGRVAWQFALKFQESVEKLVLIDASGFKTKKGMPWVFKLAKIPVVNSLISKITPRSIIEKNIKEVYFDDNKVTDELVDRYYSLTLREGNREAFIDRVKVDMQNNAEALAQLMMPTLVLWGKQDVWIPVEHAQLFAQKIPNAEVHIIKNSGHVPMEENPVESLRILEAFLSGE